MKKKEGKGLVDDLQIVFTTNIPPCQSDHVEYRFAGERERVDER